MEELYKVGQKVRFKAELQSKYDNKEHSILGVQRLHGDDTCYFLHYWYWIDEDELELV